MIRVLWFAVLLLPALPALALDNLTKDLLGLQENGSSYSTTVSEDGRYIVFDSHASNIVGNDTNNARDIFLYDRNTHQLELISVDNNGQRGSGHSRVASISADGRYVAFESLSALAPGGTNGVFQIYLRDRQTHTTRLISANASGVAGNGPAYRPHISADGSLVVFDSTASNLSGQDQNGYSDVFIKHVATGQVERVSMAAGGGQANNGSYEAQMSSDGRYVVFVSQAGNIVSPAVSSQRLVYLLDRQTGGVRLVSVDSAGSPANGACFLPDVDDQGRRVVFYSLATNLAPGLSGATVQVLLHDMTSGATSLVSSTPGGAAGNDHSYFAAISGDGRFVSFASFAGNLVTGDGNGKSDVYTRDLSSGKMTITSLANSGVLGNDSILGAPAINHDGSVIAFTSYASNLVAQDNNGYADVFIAIQNLNTPPIAVAGPPQTVECSGVTTPVTLDGRASSDPDGDPLSYTWQGDFGQAAGAVVTIPMALGSHSASLTVADGKGGQASANTSVTLRDTAAPSLSLPSLVTLEAQSRLGTAYELKPLVDDACSGVGIAIAPSYNSYPLGDNSVTVTATDSSGNSRSANMVVSVVDTTAPQLQAPPDLRQEAQQRQTEVAIGSATASDIFDVTVSNNAPAAFPLGTTPVTWRAEDSNGNVSVATQSITVEDTTAPVFLAPPVDIDAEATAVLSPLSLAVPGASDIFDVTVSSDAPSAFPLGTTLVTWQAKDSSGNLTTTMQRVKIHDSTAPSIVAPADILAEARGITSAISLGSPTAKDIFPITLGNNAPSAFPLGTTVVTWQATDSSGNIGTDTQSVTVQDTTPPVLSLPADLVLEAQAILTPVSLTPATATDIFAVSLTNNAPPLFPLGMTVVTWRAEDSNGNVSSGEQRVTVVDTTAPQMQFEQLRSSLWPPNNRFREVARLSGIQDLVDGHPQVDIDVQVVDTPIERQHRNRMWQPYERPEQGKHADRGRASRDVDDEQAEPQRASLRKGKHGGYHRQHRDWKVEERSGVWHIYVRARQPEFHGQRRYDIRVTVTDASGNANQAQAQVSISKPERNRH